MGKIIAIIPARFNSKRLPGKLLKMVNGKTILNYTFSQVKKSSLIEDIFIATDNEDILIEVKNFGGKPILTSPDHKSGSDRIAEALDKIEEEIGETVEIIVNVQGDEPLISPSTIDETIKVLVKNRDVSISTACVEIKNFEELFDINVVKVVLDREGNALFFSRLPIPFYRKGVNDMCDFQEKAKKNRILLKNYYKHIGIYVYRREFLKIFVNTEPTFLEKMEDLEQLRIIENGYKIKVVETAFDSLGIDTERDFEKFRKMIEEI